MKIIEKLRGPHRIERAAREQAIGLGGRKDVDARAVLTRVSRLTQRRRTWREADELGERVHMLKRERPELTQAEVAGELGLSRDMVNYYLHSPKHAAKTSA